MSTAVAKLNKRFYRKELEKRRVKTRAYIREESSSARLKRIFKECSFYAAIFIGTAFIFFSIGFLYFYNHYAAIVDKRVQHGFWQSRAGIYAAPYRLRVEQRISKDNVVEMLRRTGYVENDVLGEVWNGSYQVRGNLIEIRTHNLLNWQPETTIVKFAGSAISEITKGDDKVEEYEIEGEMLSGRSLAKRGQNHVLKYEDIPAHLRNAILMAEDQRFFEHRGIDPRGILRAFYTNLSEGEVRQGGSTITQQLVKNTFLSPERSLSRKIAEMFIALALETKMSKEDIFTLYCNEIYLGQYGSSGVHGVEQAARAYFDKDLKDLSVTEAAAIAAMIKNPNRFAPHKNHEDAKQRRDWIIARLAESGMVDPATAPAAQQSEIALAKPKLNDQTVAPYFVDAVTKELTSKFERDFLNSNFNMRVYTTLDTNLQAMAEQAVKSRLAELDKIYRGKNLQLQATLVAIDPHNGNILAMVGGRDYRASQFNRATDARRQPGSTFKPFVYATALERGLTPMSTFSDSPAEFRTTDGKLYKPANFGGSYAMNNITMKTALVKSSNVVAVETAMNVGLSSVARKAAEFGFQDIQTYPSLALGTMEVTPLELAAAYAVFANGGKRVKPNFIEKIVSSDNEIVYQPQPSEERVIKEKTAYMITDMLMAVVERGTARKAHGALGKSVVFAGKTGSSKDGWFVGYTPNLVAVAWVGVDENEDIKMTGGEAALPLWIDFMKSAVRTRPELGGESFAMPAGLTTVTIDPETGMLADSYCPHRETVVVPNSAVSNVRCLRHQPLPETYMAVRTEPAPVIQPSTIVIEPGRTTTVTINSRSVEVEYGQSEDQPKPKVKTVRPIEVTAPNESKTGNKRVTETLYEEYWRERKRRTDQD